MKPDFVIQNSAADRRHRPLLVTLQPNPTKAGAVDVVVLEADPAKGSIMMPTVMTAPARHRIMSDPTLRRN